MSAVVEKQRKMRLSLASLLPAVPVFCLTSAYVTHHSTTIFRPGDMVEIATELPLRKMLPFKAKATRLHDGKNCFIRDGVHPPDSASLLVLRTTADGEYIVHLQAAASTGAEDCGRSVDVVLPASGLTALRRASALNNTAAYILAAEQKGSSFQLESIPTD